MCYHRWSTEKKSVTLAALVEQNVLPFFAPYQTRVVDFHVFSKMKRNTWKFPRKNENLREIRGNSSGQGLGFGLF